MFCLRQDTPAPTNQNIQCGAHLVTRCSKLRKNYLINCSYIPLYHVLMSTEAGFQDHQIHLEQTYPGEVPCEKSKRKGLGCLRNLRMMGKPLKTTKMQMGLEDG